MKKLLNNVDGALTIIIVQLGLLIGIEFGKMIFHV